MPLEEYRRKRDFARTPEPAPGDPEGGADAPGFVVQRHDARALHFDLRLERDGALASWAVPKGVPLRGGVRRLAVRTEDHPLKYLDFAAVIPEGEYGAGRMTVWDRGTYECVSWTDREIKVHLHGRVASGEYHMVRTGWEGGLVQWVVFRAKAAGAGTEDPTESFRAMRPMLATSVPAPTDDPAWTFEVKWDGYRALALVTGDGVELRSRSGRDLTADYPELGHMRRHVTAQEVVLDGEICILDAQGRASFQALQRHDGTASFVAFDVLYVDGEWVMDRPLHERQDLLEGVVAPEAPPRVMVSRGVDGAGTALFAAAAEAGIEGVVAKRRDSRYRPGQRTRDWLKVKCRQEETVLIGGWSEGDGSRRGTVGSLLVGRPGPEGLVFTGLVGSGLTDATIRDLHRDLAGDARPDSPFAATPPDLAGANWVEPTRWCRVSYGEITSDGRMRAPVFIGMADGPDPGEAEPPLEAAPAAGADRVLADGDRQVRLTNLGKEYWPGEGITKGDLLDHYLRVSQWLVPHLTGRPMILKRYPNGIAAPHFFQHNAPDNAPPWMHLVELGRGERSTERNRYLVVDDALSLLWVANLGCIDLNPWQSRVDTPGEPTHVLFDLDPPEGMPFEVVARTALLLRERLDELGVRGYPKTSGSTGMHVFVPVAAGLSYDVTRLFAQAVCEDLARRRPHEPSPRW
ncbi:MAG: DNA ligase D [Thermoleophilia bacterium]